MFWAGEATLKRDGFTTHPRHEEPPSERDAWPYWSEERERPHEARRAAVEATMIVVAFLALFLAVHFAVEIWLPDWSGV